MIVADCTCSWCLRWRSNKNRITRRDATSAVPKEAPIEAPKIVSFFREYCAGSGELEHVLMTWVEVTVCVENCPPPALGVAAAAEANKIVPGCM